MRFPMGLLLLLGIIVFVPSRGMVLPAVLMLAVGTVLMIRDREDPGAILGIGLGSAIGFGLFAFSRLWTPTANLPGLYISTFGFAALSLLCGGFFARSMRRRRQQRTNISSS